ncbi:MAG: hypothetical protein K8T25_15690 [Planctomycetia bacterium]|nr:hypothetical protein [Planctomycetia bacterium]
MATKSRTSINSGTTMTAGAGDVSGTAVDLSASYGAQLDIKLTNGGTGPTVAAQTQIQVAADYNAGSPTLWTNFGGPLVGSTANSGTASWSVQIPFGPAAIRLVTGSNTGQNVTLDADISIVTAM